MHDLQQGSISLIILLGLCGILIIFQGALHRLTLFASVAHKRLEQEQYHRLAQLLIHEGIYRIEQNYMLSDVISVVLSRGQNVTVAGRLISTKVSDSEMLFRVIITCNAKEVSIVESRVMHNAENRLYVQDQRFL